MCACVCAFTPYSPQGATRAGVFSCSNFVRSTPPRQDGAARACRDPPRWVLEGGTPARARARATGATNAFSIARRLLHLAKEQGQFAYPFYFVYYPVEPTSTTRPVVARARGARLAKSPPQRRVHPTSGIRIAGTTAGRWARDDDARYDERRDTPFS